MKKLLVALILSIIFTISSQAEFLTTKGSLSVLGFKSFSLKLPTATVVAVAGGSPSTGTYSPNNGQTWLTNTMPEVGFNWYSISCSGSNCAAVVYGSSVGAYSTNGGQTWTANTMPGSNLNWYSISCSGSNCAAVATSSSTGAYSTNGGQTWTANTMPGSNLNWLGISFN